MLIFSVYKRRPPQKTAATKAGGIQEHSQKDYATWMRGYLKVAATGNRRDFGGCGV